MERNEAIERDKAVLLRIVSTLMFLVSFCDWLSRRPRAVRFLTLWYFRPREAFLRIRILRMIEGFGFWSALPEMTYSPEGDSSEDALRLAIRFETLAGMIDELLEIADFAKRYEPDPLAGLYEDDAQFYDVICHRPLNRRSRVDRDLMRPLLGLPCWAVRIPDT